MKRELLKQLLKKKYMQIKLYTTIETLCLEKDVRVRIHEDYIFYIHNSKEVYIDIKDIKKVEVDTCEEEEDINHFISKNKW